MSRAVFIEPSGEEVEIDVTDGWSLMQAATSHGVEGIEAECGGSCACATCHCYVESHAEALPPPAQNELDMLENAAAERRPNSRLSCQIRMSPALDGIVLRFPDTQL